MNRDVARITLSPPANWTAIHETVDEWELTCGETVWFALMLIHQALLDCPIAARPSVRDAIARAINHPTGVAS